MLIRVEWLENKQFSNLPLAKNMHKRMEKLGVILSKVAEIATPEQSPLANIMFSMTKHNSAVFVMFAENVLRSIKVDPAKVALSDKLTVDVGHGVILIIKVLPHPDYWGFSVYVDTDSPSDQAVRIKELIAHLLEQERVYLKYV